MHAIGHIAANLSFAAVAISLTHTVKTLEPAFNVVLMKLILGESTPLPAVLSLIPIMVRVSHGPLNHWYLESYDAACLGMTCSPPSEM